MVGLVDQLKRILNSSPVKIFSAITTVGFVYYFINKYWRHTYFKGRSIGFDTKRRNNELLIKYAAGGRIDAIKTLLSDGANLDATMPTSQVFSGRQMEESRLKDLREIGALEAATVMGHTTALKLLMQAPCASERAMILKMCKYSSRNTNYKFYPLLCLAAIGGYFDIIQYLIEDQKANVNVQDFNGYSPLHYASFNGNDMLVKLLLKHKCAVNLASFDDETTPLMFGKTKTVCKLLLQNGGDVYYRTSSGFSTVIVYALTNNYEGLELLLGHSGSTILFDQIAKLGHDNLECYVTDGELSIWIAAGRGFSVIVDLLCTYGVDPDSLHPLTRDSPLQLALLGKHEETVRVLKSHGASSLTIDLDRLEEGVKQEKKQVV